MKKHVSLSRSSTIDNAFDLPSVSYCSVPPSESENSQLSSQASSSLGLQANGLKPLSRKKSDSIPSRIASHVQSVKSIPARRKNKQQVKVWIITSMSGSGAHHMWCKL